jgi:hypothetical protein
MGIRWHTTKYNRENSPESYNENENEASPRQSRMKGSAEDLLRAVVIDCD